MTTLPVRLGLESRVFESSINVSQSVSHYHTPSRELMAHTLTLLKHESGYGGYLWTKVKYRAEGDVGKPNNLIVLSDKLDDRSDSLKHKR